MSPQIQPISQREAARRCLADNAVIEESKLIRLIMQRFNMSEQHAKQGVKNSVVMDGRIHRSTFRGRAYCRLAETLAPRGHLDFGTSPVNLRMTPAEHREFIAKRDVAQPAPWTQAVGPIVDKVRAKLDCCSEVRKLASDKQFASYELRDDKGIVALVTIEA